MHVADCRISMPFIDLISFFVCASLADRLTPPLPPVAFIFSANSQPSEEGDPEATGGAAGLGLGPDVQAEEVLGREDVKTYLKGVQVRGA